QDRISRLTTDLPCLPEAGVPTILGPSQPVWLDDNQVIFHGVRGGESGSYCFNVETAELEREHAAQPLSVGFSIDAAHRYVAQAAPSTLCSTSGPATVSWCCSAISAGRGPTVSTLTSRCAASGVARTTWTGWPSSTRRSSARTAIASAPVSGATATAAT